MLRSALAVLSALVLVAVALAPAGAQEDPAAARAATLAAVQKLLTEGDTFAAAEHVQAQGTTAEVLGRYGAVFGDLYWKAKDLPGAVAMGRAAMFYALTKSQELREDQETARGLRVFAQRTSFDVASFAWPGWDEKGIEIGPAELVAGLDAARLDLRLVTELEYPPEKHANAHWIVGAQLLAHGRYMEARDAFEASRDNAKKAEHADKEWMAEAYAGMALLLADANDESVRARFDTAVAKLMEIGTDDSKYLAQQLTDVLKVFSR